MNTKFKKSVRKLAVAIYRPFITRWEIYKATRMWKKGVRQCIRAYKKLNGPRFYLWFDSNTNTFIPLIHKERTKDNTLSMQYLQRTHQIRARRTMKVEDMKRECFYYTPSRYGAIGCEADNSLRLDKYNRWITFYLEKVSVPMRKLRQFQP